MGVGDFTKEGARVAHKAVEEMWGALSKKKRMEYLGHLNEVLVFLERARKHAPSAEEAD